MEEQTFANVYSGANVNVKIGILETVIPLKLAYLKRR